MSEPLLSKQTAARAAVATLFEQSPPVLVEVRFPGVATSPDWYLLNEEDDFDVLLERLGPQAELHVSSVWDLKNAKGRSDSPNSNVRPLRRRIRITPPPAPPSRNRHPSPSRSAGIPLFLMLP
jgi:hypothetical protein